MIGWIVFGFVCGAAVGAATVAMFWQRHAETDNLDRTLEARRAMRRVQSPRTVPDVEKRRSGRR